MYGVVRRGACLVSARTGSEKPKKGSAKFTKPFLKASTGLFCHGEGGCGGQGHLVANSFPCVARCVA